MSWSCPVCASTTGTTAFAVPDAGGECGITGSAFRPSANAFGSTSGEVLRCTRCGHGSVKEAPQDADLADAYSDAADPVSVREEAGQVETGRRSLALVEQHLRPGSLIDIGCWTGSLLVAGNERGWNSAGIEPSQWASQRARDRGLDVRTAELDNHGFAAGATDLVAACDVLEHLVDPGAGLDKMRDLIAPGGGLFLTVPDAGSRLARVTGRRWWSVLPMHLQYFTRASMEQLLANHGFKVLAVTTHPKVFSARYYAERLGGYSAAVERVFVGAVARAGQADRLVAPDFRDRMAVVAARV